MTTREIPTVVCKIHAYCNNFIAQRFQKTKKNRRAIFAQPIHPPSSTKKNPNDSLCSGENSLQLDEEIKSLAIIVAEK